MTAPKPTNWRAMWEAKANADNAEFARQCAIYYASLGPDDVVDITQPRYTRDDIAALTGD